MGVARSLVPRDAACSRRNPMPHDPPETHHPPEKRVGLPPLLPAYLTFRLDASQSPFTAMFAFVVPVISLLAQAASAAPAASPGGSPAASTAAAPFATQLPFFILFAVIFYFLFMRPQQKRAKEQAALLSSVRSGDEVVTSGGLHGIVTNAREGRFQDRAREIRRERQDRGRPLGHYKCDQARWQRDRRFPCRGGRGAEGMKSERRRQK